MDLDIKSDSDIYKIGLNEIQIWVEKVEYDPD